MEERIEQLSQSNTTFQIPRDERDQDDGYEDPQTEHVVRLRNVVHTDPIRYKCVNESHHRELDGQSDANEDQDGIASYERPHFAGGGGFGGAN